MNCAEVDRILGSQRSDALAPAHKRVVDTHLASCKECRDAWSAYRRLIAEPVPPTSRELSQKVSSALRATRRAEPRTVRSGRLALGIALLAGAAAAGALAYRILEVERMVPSVSVGGDEAATAILSPATGAVQSPPATIPSVEPSSDAAVEASAVRTTGDYSLDAYSVVVLTMPGPFVSQEIAGSFEQCHEYVLRELRAIDGVNVIAGAQVAPYGDSRRPPEEIGRELGSGRVLVLRTASAVNLERLAALPREPNSRIGSCYADLMDVRTSAGSIVAGRDSSRWSAESSRAFAADVAHGVRNAILEDRGELVTRAQETVLDPAVDVLRRVGALHTLRGGRAYAERLDADEVLRMAAEPIPGAFTDAVVAAVADIGTTSSDAMMRLYAWRHVRGVRNPMLTQALLHSLASDGDASVRCQAALALGYLVDEPGVRGALLRTAVEDPSTEPPLHGCNMSVRAAAVRALQSNDELRAASLRTLLDTTLESVARLAPLYESVDGRGVPAALDETAAHAVFEIGRESADPRIRAHAWEMLGNSALAEFTPTLIEDVAGHAAEEVRAAAAAALAPYAEETEVSAALEQAWSDPALVVRRAARRALGGAGAE